MYFLLCCFQVKLSEKALLLEKADGKTAELTVKVNEQQKLIQKLEDDILKVGIKVYGYIQLFFFQLQCWQMELL